MKKLLLLFVFFFFQAEDGIRDRDVTEFRRVLFRSHWPCRRRRHSPHQSRPRSAYGLGEVVAALLVPHLIAGVARIAKDRADRGLAPRNPSRWGLRCVRDHAPRAGGSGAAVRKDAELVPLWVGKYDPALIAGLADVGVSST